MTPDEQIAAWRAAGLVVEERGRTRLPEPPRPTHTRGRASRTVPLLASAFVPPATWLIPLRLDPVTNGGAIKRGLIGVAGRHRRAVAAALASHLRVLAELRDVIDAGGRLACAITRLGGRAMDTDNLAVTSKWVRDTVAMFLGVGDGPDDPITWRYGQEPGGAYGVRVTLEGAGC